MARLGIAIAAYDDTMLISYVLEGGAHGHGMDELAELHLGHKTITTATSPAPASRRSPSTTCRSTRRATMPPKTPTSRCAARRC